MTNRLTKQRDESAAKRAQKLHREAMKNDPEYAAKWNAMLGGITDILCDENFKAPDED